MVRKNLGDCARSRISYERVSPQSKRSPSPSSAANAPAGAVAHVPEGTAVRPKKVSRTQSVDSVMSSGQASPTLNGFQAVSPLMSGHPDQSMASPAGGPGALPSEHLLSTVSASIESVERGRAAAERALTASEERVKLLEKRLAEEQERRLALLEDQMEALRVQNAALKADIFLQRRDPDFAANEGAAEAAELDQWLGGLNLARYTPALVQEGYDALEFLLAASTEEIASLCVSAKLKAPHAQKLTREVASLKDTAGTGVGSK